MDEMERRRRGAKSLRNKVRAIFAPDTGTLLLIEGAEQSARAQGCVDFIDCVKAWAQEFVATHGVPERPVDRAAAVAGPGKGAPPA